MNTELIVGIILALGAAYLFTKTKKKKSAARGGGEVPDSGWRIGPFDQSRNMPSSPTIEGDGWYVDFPAAPGSLNYVQWFSPPKLGESLTLRYRVGGGPVTAQEYPEAGTVSLIIQRKGDNWRSAGYRWWAGMFPLTPGEHSVTVPLTVEHWGDMLGTPDAEAFAATLRDTWNIGVAFGSPGAPTHGVYGSGRFTLRSLG